MISVNTLIENVLTIAGSDSSAGAGIQADLKTFSALGVYGVTAITALTAQNSQGVQAIEAVTPAFLGQQLAAIDADIQLSAIKTGMLCNDELVSEVVAFIDRHQDIPLVVDPVMVSTSGRQLLSSKAIEIVREQLLPRTALMTPNIAEAAVLLGEEEINSVEQMFDTAEALYTLGTSSVLLKGGHLCGTQCPDIYYDGSQFKELIAPRINTENTHGTGCTLASAVCAFLAKGEPMEMAVSSAKEYIQAAISSADRLNVGSGHGPLHHFHAYW